MSIMNLAVTLGSSVVLAALGQSLASTRQGGSVPRKGHDVNVTAPLAGELVALREHLGIRSSTPSRDSPTSCERRLVGEFLMKRSG
jgi:hypothetical protein